MVVGIWFLVKHHKNLMYTDFSGLSVVMAACVSLVRPYDKREHCISTVANMHDFLMIRIIKMLHVIRNKLAFFITNLLY